ncbi:hypothetical protein ECEC1737_2798, partial [Escherichia coli EC1737]
PVSVIAGLWRLLFASSG